jgi:hypothetical protein
MLIIGTAILLGWLIAEFITERRRMKVALPELLDELREGSRPVGEIIREAAC